MHFLLAGKVLLSLETQTEMSMEYDSTECEFWCQIAKVRSTEQFVGLTCKQRDTHSWENVRGCACTEQRAFLREYVTTVTMMSSARSEECVSSCWGEEGRDVTTVTMMSSDRSEEWEGISL